MSLFMYGITTNTGKDFFTRQNRLDFFIESHIGDVWVVGNNEKGALWLASKNAVIKTKAEAQAIVDAEITAAQAAWDALEFESSEERSLANGARPGPVTLP